MDEDTTKNVLMTRRRGWAHSHGERGAGVASVSAPVFGPWGARSSARCRSPAPASRILPMRAKDFAPAVLESARTIQAAVGAG